MTERANRRMFYKSLAVPVGFWYGLSLNAQSEGAAMSLVYCPECGFAVSSQAQACPRCGCPVARNVMTWREAERIRAKLKVCLGCVVLAPLFGLAALQVEELVIPAVALLAAGVVGLVLQRSRLTRISKSRRHYRRTLN